MVCILLKTGLVDLFPVCEEVTQRSHSRLQAKTFPGRCKSISASIPPAGEPKVSRIHQLSSGDVGLLFLLGLNVRATLLMQNRWPVGSGPSSNTCPRCASHWKKRHTDVMSVEKFKVAL